MPAQPGNGDKNAFWRAITFTLVAINTSSGLEGEGMRSPIICFILLAVAVLLLIRPVVAQVTTEAGTIQRIPFFRAGPAWYLNPEASAGLFIREINTSSLATADTAAFALSFAPGPGGLPVTPTIAQTSSRTIVAEQCYFYRDFEEL